MESQKRCKTGLPEMENLIFFCGTYIKELNDAINVGIAEISRPNNATRGHLDMAEIVSEEYLKFFKWLLSNNDTCLELEDEYG